MGLNGKKWLCAAAKINGEGFVVVAVVVVAVGGVLSLL